MHLSLVAPVGKGEREVSVSDSNRNTSSTSRPAWLLLFGMPKCGTTSLGAILDCSPVLAVHSQKEPNDFIERCPGGLPKISGYAATDATQYFVDFSTQYGMPRHRDRVLENLCSLGLLPTAKFIVSLREPHALAKSYFGHLTSRSGLKSKTDGDEIRDRIIGATDFVPVLDTLLAQVESENVFVVKFEDLLGLEAQTRTSLALSNWLDIPAIEFVSVKKSNVASDARRYPVVIEKLAKVVRKADIVRRLPPNFRRRVSRSLSYRVSNDDTHFELDRWTDGRILARSAAFYELLSTGPYDPANKLGTIF
ncbi:sulfotransferase domain-containing protein [Tropicimonas aquimaris]|uniref:Sulfotransferase domain-containing protein n=1 Tax=Tropicimonas aquimaris TaxID=914152 RepID=A0ABW3IWT9_9RHOB